MFSLTSSPSPTQRFSWTRPLRTSRPACFIGIDIGVQEIRVASLGFQSKSKQRLRWKSKFCFDLQDALPEEPSPQWIQGIVEALLTRLPRCVDGETQMTALSIPLSWTLYQTAPSEGLQLAQSESNEIFLHSIFNSPSHTAHWPISCETDSQHTDPPLVLASVSQRLACQLVSQISELGYKVETILPHGVALADAAQPLTQVETECIALLESTGSLATLRNESGAGMCRVLPEFPEELAQQKGEGRLPHGKQPWELRSIEPWLIKVAKEIKATTNYVRRLPGTGLTDQPILICGEISETPGIEGRLADLLGEPVSKWRYAGRSRPTRCSQISTQTEVGSEDARYATALSLAYAATRCSTKGYCG